MNRSQKLVELCESDKADASKILKRLEQHILDIKDDVKAWVADPENDYPEDAYTPEKAAPSLDYIERYLAKGWSADDVFRLFCLTEEIDPRISEESALRRMKLISDKYKTSK